MRADVGGHFATEFPPATDETMKDEDVTLYFKPRILWKLCCIQNISFLLSDIESTYRTQKQLWSIFRAVLFYFLAAFWRVRAKMGR